MNDGMVALVATVGILALAFVIYLVLGAIAVVCLNVLFALGVPVTLKTAAAAGFLAAIISNGTTTAKGGK